MPLIQWVMQNLKMGAPGWQGRGSAYTSGTASTLLGLLYVADGGIWIDGSALVPPLNFYHEGYGWIQLFGTAPVVFEPNYRFKIIVERGDDYIPALVAEYKKFLDALQELEDMPPVPMPEAGRMTQWQHSNAPDYFKKYAEIVHRLADLEQIFPDQEVTSGTRSITQQSSYPLLEEYNRVVGSLRKLFSVNVSPPPTPATFIIKSPTVIDLPNRAAEQLARLQGLNSHPVPTGGQMAVTTTSKTTVSRVKSIPVPTRQYPTPTGGQYKVVAGNGATEDLNRLRSEITSALEQVEAINV